MDLQRQQFESHTSHVRESRREEVIQNNNNRLDHNNDILDNIKLNKIWKNNLDTGFKRMRV